MESKKAKDFVPKNKFDQQSLFGIDELSNEEIQPIIYELLTWLQDYNWPVADKVLQVLRKREILVFPYLADILAGNDIMWKIWIMELLVPTLTTEHKEALRKNIFDLSKVPSYDEDDIALKEAAAQCYQVCFDVNKR